MMTSLEAVRVLNEAVAKAGVAKDGNLLKAYLKLLKLEYVDYSNQRSKALWGLDLDPPSPNSFCILS
ncbi:TPA: hypothetical protein R7J68_005085 [Klebsiella pneumoniae]|nr:hypothetical protein [Klebsiella pneumoniae]